MGILPGMDLVWFKSSRSAGNVSCVEVAATPGVVLVRDSKDPDGPRLAFDSHGWATFVASVQAGEFD